MKYLSDYNKFRILFENNDSQKKVAILTDNKFQDREVIQPKEALEKYCQVDIISTNTGTIKAFNNDTTVEVTKTIKEANPDDYQLLVIPGGKAPESLRKNKSVLDFVKKFYQTGKPIAAICHGPLILVSANLVEGKKMTCYEDAVEELKEAGAQYVDDSCVIDSQFITSRNPDDLDDFCDAIKEKIK